MSLQLCLDPFDLERATIGTALEERAELMPDKVFLTHLPDDRRYTYHDIDEVTATLGANLSRLGIKRGIHIAILMENCPEQLISIWGASRAGRIAVPLNSAAKGQLLAYFLNHSDSQVLIVESHLLPRFLEIAADVPAITHVIVANDCRPGAPNEATPPDPMPHSSVPSFHSFSELLKAPTTEGMDDVHFSELALLMFTSGTTGPSKAIMFSHAQLIYWGTDVATHHEYTDQDVTYIYLPLFHGNALLGSTMGTFMAGASIALTHRFSARSFWKDIKHCGATVFNAVGAVTNFLWAQPPSATDREHAVQRVHLAPVPKFAHQFEERYGVKIMSAFGLTDYCLGTFYNTQSRRDKLGSTGLPRQNVEIRVVDEYDRDKPAGEPGEITLRNTCPWSASRSRISITRPW